MAAGILSPVGSDYGPCEDECQHTDCASLRGQAATPCSLCGDAISYETRFYNTSQPGTPAVYAHALCEERRIEEQLYAS